MNILTFEERHYKEQRDTTINYGSEKRLIVNADVNQYIKGKKEVNPMTD